MPYIGIKTDKQMSKRQERVLSEELSRAITLLPGKTTEGLMVSVSSDVSLFKGGRALENGAYVNVVLKTGPSREECERLNTEIFAILEEYLRLPAEKVYVSFFFCDLFGVNRKLI